MVTEPRREILQQSMTKYFRIADGQDFDSTFEKKEKEEYVDSGFMAPGKFIATFLTEMICWAALQKLQKIADIYRKN